MKQFVGIPLAEIEYGNGIDGQQRRCHPIKRPCQSREAEQDENDAKRGAPVTSDKRSQYRLAGQPDQA